MTETQTLPKPIILPRMEDLNKFDPDQKWMFGDLVAVHIGEMLCDTIDARTGKPMSKRQRIEKGYHMFARARAIDVAFETAKSKSEGKSTIAFKQYVTVSHDLQHVVDWTNPLVVFTTSYKKRPVILTVHLTR